MDLVTQAALGAAVGEVTLGKDVGNRALSWGALLGILPDADVLASLYSNEVETLVAHRAFTHSLAFCFIAAPIAGYLLHRLHRRFLPVTLDWAKLAFWVFLTHTLLDCCTTWGTQLFYPFSDHRVAFNSVFVVDPLYTLPLLIGIVAALRLKSSQRARRLWVGTTLLLSTLYLIVAGANKLVAEAYFTNALHEQGRSAQRIATFPTPFNSLVWYALAETPTGYHLGYHSVLADRHDAIPFRFLPKRHDLLSPARQQDYPIEALRWVSDGFYALRQAPNGELQWLDLRFGFLNGLDASVPPDSLQPSFAYTFVHENETITDIRQIDPQPPAGLSDYLFSTLLPRLWQQMW